MRFGHSLIHDRPAFPSIVYIGLRGFSSHSTNDTTLVTLLKNSLDNDGVEVILAEEKLEPGVVLDLTLKAATRDRSLRGCHSGLPVFVVRRSARTVENIRGVDVGGQKVIVKYGKVTEYRVNLKLSFGVE